MPNKTAGIWEMESLELDGTWQAVILRYANLYILQCRQANDINVSHNRRGMGYFSIKSGQSLPLSSFSLDTGGETQTLYFRGTAGNVLEMLKQKQP